MSEFTEISYLDLDNLRKPYVPNSDKENLTPFKTFEEDSEIGRASCRERV